MPAFAPFTLATQRLQLRFLSTADVPALYRMYSDAEAMRYWSSAPWDDMRQAEAYFAAALAGYESGELLRMGIEADGQLAGVVNLYSFNRQNQRCDIGYMLDRACWGKGYMQEAMAALLDHAFRVWSLHRIEADIDPRNTASAKLLKSLHFVYEGHMRERWIVNGEICDTDFFGLLRADWIAAR
ncbi:GNAT family N-acetyltransferase [Pseudoduganella violaceinigra]|uniref:GNAT family N-acetyltransferase n=1 Tax=Pseudoduganella violaceinigra TaxID=246602 RepID=UPI0004028FE7|nr:GNAT family protein [Pseudoduganella violaceinigra]